MSDTLDQKAQACIEWQQAAFNCNQAIDALRALTSRPNSKAGRLYKYANLERIQHAAQYVVACIDADREALARYSKYLDKYGS